MSIRSSQIGNTMETARRHVTSIMTFSKTSPLDGRVHVCTRSNAKVDREYADCRKDGDGGDDSDRMKMNGSWGM